MIRATTIGNSWVQQKLISWSYLTRGNVARNQTKMKQNTQVLRANIILWRFIKVSFTNSSGLIYPPRNNMALRTLIKIMLQYSARKKQTKIIPECSVKYPATSSDSLSGKSKGVRLVSANTEMKKITNRGRSGIIYQTDCWVWIMVV